MRGDLAMIWIAFIWYEEANVAVSHGSTLQKRIQHFRTLSWPLSCLSSTTKYFY